MSKSFSDLSNSGPVDYQYLDQETRDLIMDLMDNDTEMVVDLIDTHLDTMPALIDGLVSGVSQGDAHQVREAAHAMKSSNAQLGALQLSEICQILEDCAKGGDLSLAPSLVTQFQEEYKHSESALFSWKNHLQNE